MNWRLLVIGVLAASIAIYGQAQLDASCQKRGGLMVRTAFLQECVKAEVLKP